MSREGRNKKIIWGVLGILIIVGVIVVIVTGRHKEQVDVETTEQETTSESSWASYALEDSEGERVKSEASGEPETAAETTQKAAPESVPETTAGTTSKTRSETAPETTTESSQETTVETAREGAPEIASATTPETASEVKPSKTDAETSTTETLTQSNSDVIVNGDVVLNNATDKEYVPSANVDSDGIDHGPEGDKEGYIYVPGYGYVDTSNASLGDGSDHDGVFESDMTGEKIGVMN